MVTDKRTFIVSNLHRDEANNLNNDITITLPNSIFSGKVEAVNLKHLSIDYAVETVGTSNYEFGIRYPETNLLRTITLDIDAITSNIVKTDADLADLIATSINSTLGTTEFHVYFDPIIISNQDVYRDNSELLNRYTIFTINQVAFTLDFSSKQSIGPLIGFGNDVYNGTFSYRGGNIPPVYAYESIHVANKAFDTIFKEYDNLNDIACKMDLYDSDNVLIPNRIDARDTTISIPIADGYITSIHEFIGYIRTELNYYSSYFENSPTFDVDFDLDTYKFTFSNDKDVRFGIGFRFNRFDATLNPINNYGSLHNHLGFQKTVYLGYKRISSVKHARIFERAYISEHLFVCSDLIKYNYDTNLIVTESSGNSSKYESIFTIPISQIVDGSYSPPFEDEHRVRIHASMLAKQYNEDLDSDKKINFYLKVSSGRHIKLNTQWSLKFEIEYVN